MSETSSGLGQVPPGMLVPASEMNETATERRPMVARYCGNCGDPTMWSGVEGEAMDWECDQCRYVTAIAPSLDVLESRDSRTEAT